MIEKLKALLDFENNLEALFSFERNLDPLVEARLLESLEKIGIDKVIKALLDLKNDSDEEARQYIVIALGNIGRDEATEALLSFKNDPDSTVQAVMLEALSRIGTDKALEALLSFKKKGYEIAFLLREMSDRFPHQKQKIISAISQDHSKSKDLEETLIHIVQNTLYPEFWSAYYPGGSQPILPQISEQIDNDNLIKKLNQLSVTQVFFL